MGGVDPAAWRLVESGGVGGHLATEAEACRAGRVSTVAAAAGPRGGTPEAVVVVIAGEAAAVASSVGRAHRGEGAGWWARVDGGRWTWW